MKRLTAVLLLVIGLSGCTVLPGEERAFAVALCVEHAEEAWQAYARVPAYQAEGGYATIHGAGSTLDSAISALEAASPMQLSFGQLRLIVLSASSGAGDIVQSALRILARKRDIRPDALVSVAYARAGEVCDSMNPVTGTRLSKSLEKLFEAKREQGRMPFVTLNDISRMGGRESLVLPCLRVERAEGEQEARIGFEGCVLFGMNGMRALTLDESETRLLCVLRGQMSRGRLQVEGEEMTFTGITSRTRLLTEGISTTITMRAAGTAPSVNGIEAQLTQAFRALTQKLQNAGCDALGLARQSIAGADTWQTWIDSDWGGKYPDLPWEVRVRVEASD